ncbi:protein translocase subunit SecD [Kiloniella sp. b19]|uniref:protein translocase subunit SecD n=1 Tax=Kiloniella sp. GXU_MW_B19 TaxID=3141326 RepID=UPI0031E12965
MLQFPRWKIFLVLAVLLAGLAFASPNLLPKSVTDNLPDWAPSNQVNLGLDLQGGASLLMEVDLAFAADERVKNVLEFIRDNLRSARIGYQNLSVSEGSVVFDLRNPDDATRERMRAIISQLSQGLLISTDEARVTVSFSEASTVEWRSRLVEQSIEITRARLDETGTKEPSIQRQGEDRILIQVPGEKDPDRIKQIIGKTAKLNFRMVDQSADPNALRAPADAEILLSNNPENPQRYVIKKRILVSGENLSDAQATFQDGQPVVSITFDATGGKRFADATLANVGRPFAIVLDGKVISAPVIRSAILSGSAIISGGFTVEEAGDLAILLRAGALPAPLIVLEERSVGPGLGADSVLAGQIAAALGLALVIVFMAVAYGSFGLMANAALVSNLILIFAALSALQATLTLPGIAGIVLTIGMAVDANVLIFERIREEVRQGQSLTAAIDNGYKRAVTTILDSNITTLIAAFLLFQFGTGPIKGFAVTLTIGLLTSMFTAIMLTRLIVILWLRRNRSKALPI